MLSNDVNPPSIPPKGGAQHHNAKPREKSYPYATHGRTPLAKPSRCTRPTGTDTARTPEKTRVTQARGEASAQLQERKSANWPVPGTVDLADLSDRTNWTLTANSPRHEFSRIRPHSGQRIQACPACCRVFAAKAGKNSGPPRRARVGADPMLLHLAVGAVEDVVAVQAPQHGRCVVNFLAIAADPLLQQLVGLRGRVGWRGGSVSIQRAPKYHCEWHADGSGKGGEYSRRGFRYAGASCWLGCSCVPETISACSACPDGWLAVVAAALVFRRVDCAAMELPGTQQPLSGERTAYNPERQHSSTQKRRL
jgi:hypothetical protein